MKNVFKSKEGCSLGPFKWLTVERPRKKRGPHKYVVMGLISHKYVKVKTKELICNMPLMVLITSIDVLQQG